jgi:hypothetical protein
MSLMPPVNAIQAIGQVSIALAAEFNVRMDPNA